MARWAEQVKGVGGSLAQLVVHTAQVGTVLLRQATEAADDFVASLAERPTPPPSGEGQTKEKEAEP